MEIKFLMQVLGLTMVVMLIGCSSTSPPKAKAKSTSESAFVIPKSRDAAPKLSKHKLAKLHKVPNAKPKPEPKSKRGNAKTYRVFGKAYQTLKTNVGFREVGLASWYGTQFHGRQTSNGEVYDMFGMTAAHKHLPLPTYAKVTNLENGKHIIVKINDRGPFHGDRIIDLSFTAALKLGMLASGTAKVEIKSLH